MHMNQWQEKKKNSKILNCFFKIKVLKYTEYIYRERELQKTKLLLWIFEKMNNNSNKKRPFPRYLAFKLNFN